MSRVHLFKKTSRLIGQKESYLGLLLWTILGTILRFTNLTAKPPWTDEFATMVFSLGNDFASIPVNKVMSVEEFLTPLRVNTATTPMEVARLILDKDNHPPLYFILSHLWIKLLTNPGEYVNLWVMRSLPALLGVLSIPLTYWLGKKIFKSAKIAQLCTGMMAISPYGIFLSQEARHYTLAILFVLGSLGCFILTFTALSRQERLSYRLILLWIIVNSLGLSVHYFLSLAFVAQGLSLLGLLLTQWRRNTLKISHWIPLIWIILGTAVTGGIWAYFSLSNGYGNEMTAWIQRHDYPILGMINPPFQLLAAWITMFTLLPVESSNLIIVIVSGFLMLLFFLWLIPLLRKSLKLSLLEAETKYPTQALLSFIISLLILTFTITYGLGIDITRGARYSFNFFPPIVLLLGVILYTLSYHPYFKSAQIIPKPMAKFLDPLTSNQPKIAIVMIAIMGLLGSMTVLVNLGYQKYYLPDRLATVMEQKATAPILVVAPYISLAQTGEIMGIAWEAVQQNLSPSPSFIILKEDNTTTYQLPSFLQKVHNPTLYPLEIWSVNFYYSSLNLEENCQISEEKLPPINGYIYRRFSCL